MFSVYCAREPGETRRGLCRRGSGFDGFFMYNGDVNRFVSNGEP